LEPETIPEIKADMLSMLRVFRNFVDNALKYGGEGLSEISIGYQGNDDFHIFSVSDNGEGIRGGDYEGLFAAFRRDDTSKAVEGAGLGLAIVSEIAERHKGRVWAEPGKDQGAIFFISVSKDL
jgi:K+-sensing histidine kinase KdpD